MERNASGNETLLFSYIFVFLLLNEICLSLVNKEPFLSVVPC